MLVVLLLFGMQLWNKAMLFMKCMLEPRYDKQQGIVTLKGRGETVAACLVNEAGSCCRRGISARASWRDLAGT